MNPEDEEVYKNFRETLYADLRQNIKPVIISLTMVAEDYQKSGHVIALSIEEYIRKVTPDLKILGLYLMDSIMKNLKKTTYIQIFDKNIVQLFAYVFESVDEQNRKALYKLRQTWSDVFTNDRLYDLDILVKKIDPAWPITASVKTAARLKPPSSDTNSAIQVNKSIDSVNQKPQNNVNNSLKQLTGLNISHHQEVLSSNTKSSTNSSLVSYVTSSKSSVSNISPEVIIVIF